MHITLGGGIFLAFIGLVIAGIVVFNRWRSGAPVSFNRESIKRGLTREKAPDDTILCLNVYQDRIVGEYIPKDKVNSDADRWELGTKKYILQQIPDKEPGQLELPDTIAYPPERLARMMGCEPLRKLKSLKFKWYEQLAPFAPVIAFVIAAILFIVVT